MNSLRSSALLNILTCQSNRRWISWLCRNMKTSDVTETLDIALHASGCDQAHVVHKPRLLSDKGPSYISGELAEWRGVKKLRHVRRVISSTNTGQDRAMAPDPEELLLSSRSGGADRGVRRSLQPSTLSRKLQQPHPRKRLLRAWQAILKKRKRIKRKRTEAGRLQYPKNAA